MNSSVLVFVLGLSFFASFSSAQCPPPTLAPGETLVSDTRCRAGGTYQQSNPRASCTCVANCGYRCTPVQGSPTKVPTTTTTTTTSTTTTPTTTPTTTSTTTSSSTTSTTTGSSATSTTSTGSSTTSAIPG